MRQEDGFTLIEVVVGAALALVVSGLAFSAFLFIVRNGENVREHVALQDGVHVALEAFVADVRGSDASSVDEDGGLLLRTQRDTIRYDYDGVRVLRNGHRLQPAGISAFTVRQVDRGMERWIELTLAATDGRHTTTATTSILSRRPGTWPPLDR